MNRSLSLAFWLVELVFVIDLIGWIYVSVE